MKPKVYLQVHLSYSLSLHFHLFFKIRGKKLNKKFKKFNLINFSPYNYHLKENITNGCIFFLLYKDKFVFKNSLS